MTMGPEPMMRTRWGLEVTKKASQSQREFVLHALAHHLGEGGDLAEEAEGLLVLLRDDAAELVEAGGAGVVGGHQRQLAADAFAARARQQPDTHRGDAGLLYLGDEEREAADGAVRLTDKHRAATFSRKQARQAFLGRSLREAALLSHIVPEAVADGEDRRGGGGRCL